MKGLTILMGLMAGFVSGQTPTGSISGTVADASGAQVPGATVRLANTNTHETKSTTTSSTGTYLFPIVAVGDYFLEAEASGFKIQKRTGVTLDVNQNARIDFTL